MTRIYPEPALPASARAARVARPAPGARRSGRIAPLVLATALLLPGPARAVEQAAGPPAPDGPGLADDLLIPPGAALALAPDRVRPGDAFLVTVAGIEAPPAAGVAGRELRFYRVPGGWQAVAALPVEAEPGTLEVEARLAGGAALRARMVVAEPAFPEAQLRVAPRFVTPSPAEKRRMERDQAAFVRAFAAPFGPPTFAGPFAPPREADVTSSFGEKRIFNGRKQGQHYGTDLAGEVGAPVAAANDGRVVLARDCFASGKSLVVAHGGGIHTVYFHLSQMEVRAGQEVRRGQLVGRVGQTGRVTGPHLHFGAKVGDLYVDPESVYRLAFDAPAAADGRPAVR